MSASRAAFDAAISTLAKLGGALISIKILASNFGPEGLGQLGQFMSVVALLSVATSGGCAVGVSRYVAQQNPNQPAFEDLIRTASWVLITSCALIATCTIIWAETISQTLFGIDDYATTLRICCIFLLPLGYSSLGLAVINGLSATSALVGIQIGSAFIGVSGLILAVSLWQLKGAAIGLLWMASCYVIFIAIWWQKKKPANFKVFFPKRNNKTFLILARYAALTFISIICHNFSQIIIRSWLHTGGNWDDVGFWQAMTRISDAYLQMINVFFIAYLLPRLSKEQDKSKAISIVNGMYVFILPLLFIILVIGYAARDLVISTLLTSNFYYTRELFLPQMLGDFFKIAAFIPGYLVLARGYMPLLFLADPIQILMLLVFSSLSIPSYGALGACWAYFITYFLYAILSLTVFWFFRKSVLYK